MKREIQCLKRILEHQLGPVRRKASNSSPVKLSQVGAIKEDLTIAGIKQVLPAAYRWSICRSRFRPPARGSRPVPKGERDIVDGIYSSAPCRRADSPAKPPPILKRFDTFLISRIISSRLTLLHINGGGHCQYGVVLRSFGHIVRSGV